MLIRIIQCLLASSKKSRNMKQHTLVLVFVIVSVQLVRCANILAIFPVCSLSHFKMIEPLMKGLADRGHQVDVVGYFPQKQPVLRYTDILIDNSTFLFTNNISIEFVGGKNPWTMVNFLLTYGADVLCDELLKKASIKTLKRGKYNLLITEIFGADCSAGFAHHFNVPLVSVISSTILPWGNGRIGNPDNPSYIPNYFLPYTSKMTFFERLINTIFTIATKTLYDLYTLLRFNTAASEFFGSDLPNLQTIVQNTSLILVNSHFSINQVRPTVPNFVEVAGLHIVEPKPLPKFLQELFETDTEGIIYLSMGSMIMTETIDEDKLQGIFDAFAELPYKVVWKATKEKFSSNLRFPSNIHFEPWLPQLDVLCHPNVKLFVTHGGLMGNQEAIYCGVPMLGIPIFADQHFNIQNSVHKKLALKINYEDITKETVLEAATKLLKDPTYRETARHISNLFKDRLSSPLETAIYWVEYVIRYNGAPHLRSAGADLYWYQYYLVDVFSVIIIAVLMMYYFIRYAIKLVFTKSRKLKIKKS